MTYRQRPEALGNSPRIAALGYRIDDELNSVSAEMLRHNTFSFFPFFPASSRDMMIAPFCFCKRAITPALGMGTGMKESRTPTCSLLIDQERVHLSARHCVKPERKTKKEKRCDINAKKREVGMLSHLHPLRHFLLHGVHCPAILPHGNHRLAI